MHENVKEVFRFLRSFCGSMTKHITSKLEEFVLIIHVYILSSPANRVNDPRHDRFARKQRPYNDMPSSRAALVEYIER